jgi:hypothetical protein
VQMLATSKAYIYIGLDGPDAAGDLTQYPPKAALIDDDGTEPLPDDWKAAAWIDGEVALLVGPGSPNVYAVGEYMAFAMLTAGQEIPVMKSGRVTIG